MIVTSRCAKFLQSLPDADAAALLDAVARCAADPLANPRHCKRLASNLYECRVSLPPSRQFRLMFSYHRDGVPVLLSGCMKKSNAVHEREIRTARAALSSDEPLEGVAMPKNAEPPLFSSTVGWIYAGNRQYKVIHHTRRRIVIQTDDGPVQLNRSRLEQTGQDIVNGTTYRTSRYVLPHELGEIAS